MGEPASPAGGAIRRQRWSTRRRRLAWTLALVGVLVVFALGTLWVLRESPEPHVPGARPPEITSRLARGLPPDAPSLVFTDLTEEAGLGSFRTFQGTRSSQLPEDMGGGVAWGDYDGDGDEDLFVVAAGGSLDADPAAWAPSRLYENLGDGAFREAPAFPELRIVGMGAAWGDADNDGRLDLVVTGFRTLRLYLNRGDRFEASDLIPELPGFWSGAAWGDFDGDGDLDLYVCGYVRYEPAAGDRTRTALQYGRAVPYTLNPAAFRPERNLLFVQTAGGFEERAEALGVANPEGRSLGAVWHDFDQDGRLDLYVANDISDNAFFHQSGDRFEDLSHEAWVADYRGAMGLAVGDWNRDGDDDLFITHWVAQENALYDSRLADARQRPPGDGQRKAASPDGPRVPVRFVDVADQVGLGQIALRKVGWGAAFADLDLDGWLDLVAVNGSTFEDPADRVRLLPETDFVFWNRRGRSFHDLAPTSGAWKEARVSRGLALADYDRDGDLDVARVDLDGGVRLLRNDTEAETWIGIRPLAPAKAGAWREAPGAAVTVRAGGRALRGRGGGPSYLSQHTRTVLFGLGGATQVEEVTVHWPDGTATHTGSLEAGAVYEIRQGEADPLRVYLAVEDGRERSLDPRRRLETFWRLQREAIRAARVEGDCRRAVPLFRRALELQPDHEDARYYLANCLEATGDVAGAVAELEALVRANPMSHRGLKRLGTLLAEHATSPGDLERAEAVLRRAIAINPEETGGLMAAAEVALMRGDRKEARRRLELVLQSNPGALGARYLLAYLDALDGDLASARANLKAAAGLLESSRRRPEGATEEGDAAAKMHQETLPLARVWETWDGTTDPEAAFAPLRRELRRRGAGSVL